MYTALTYLTIAEADLDQYVGIRRDRINPAMEAHGGFVSSEFLRPEQPADIPTFVLVNTWTDYERQQGFANGSAYRKAGESARPLIRDARGNIYRTVETSPAVTSANGSIGAAVLTSERVVLAELASAPGFVNATVMAQVDDDDAFVTYSRWTTDDAAAAFFPGQTRYHPVPV